MPDIDPDWDEPAGVEDDPIEREATTLENTLSTCHVDAPVQSTADVIHSSLGTTYTAPDTSHAVFMTKEVMT